MRHIMHASQSKKGKRSYREIDALALVVGILQPLMTLPQIIVVFQAKDASQLSLLTWVAYDIASVVLLIYGIVHKLKPIVVAQIFWLIVQSVLILAIFLF